MKTYDLEKLQALLHDFYNLTGIKICIYDDKGNEVCYYPERLSSFCALLRTDPQMDARCQSCDREAIAKCKKTREQYAYTCHAGLLECVSPILYGDKVIGYVAVGQIKADERTAFRLTERDPSRAESLHRCFAGLPAIGMDKINSAMRILDACAGYEYLKRLVSSAEKIDTAMDQYIRNNLEKGLSVSGLCSEFHLSHSEIYSIFKEYFDATPAEYIKTCRVEKACRLLRSTRLPVCEIAELCGIPDYNYFSKIFKRRMGMSPREFRKTAIDGKGK